MTLSYEVAGQRAAVALDAVDQRLWLDAVYGAISSDGKRVFAIRNLDTVQMRGNTRFGMRPFGRMGESLDAPGNTLTAYDLRTEGKRLWKADGENHPQLDGCFFLGPPIAVGDTLYVIAEFANSIHLIQIDAAEGEIQWKQPLANLERSVLFDAGRRLAGATPAYANGLVICPTGAGSVVAVDPVDRSLQWAFRFEVDPAAATRTNAGWQQAFGAYQPALEAQWHRNRALVAGNVVLVTAPECDQLYCLDLATGLKRWSINRGDHCYLAGVAKNRAVLVGDNHVSLIELATGKPVAGAAKLELPSGQSIAGLGVLAETLLMLPLSGNEIGIVDIAKGAVQRTLALREGDAAGNLAFHRGALVLQSATSVARFDQLSTLRDQLAGSNVPSATALRVEGELAWGEGDLDRAIDLFRGAYKLEPDESQIRRRFSSAPFAGMRADYQRYRKDDQLLSELLNDSAQRIELLRFHIEGSLAAGDPAAALGYATALYEIDREGLIDANDRGHQVQAERWFAARLGEIWERADASERNRIADRIAELEADVVDKGTTSQLSRFVSYFGAIPAGRDARVALAHEWMASNRVREAELLLLQTDPAERVAQLRDFDAAEQLPLADELLPADHPQRLARDDTAYLADWPDGSVEVDVAPGRVAAAAPADFGTGGQSRNRNNLRFMIEPLWGGVPWSGPRRLAISYGSPPQLLAWNELGEVTHGVPLQFALLQNANSNTQVRCIRFGHFAVLAAGEDIAAIDLRSAALRQSPTMWTSDNDNSSRSRTLRALQNRGSTVFIPDQSPTPPGPAGELCTAAPLGVVVRSDDVLRCFDPVDGDLLWQRRDVPTSGTTFGDWQYLFLLADGDTTGIIISLIDGTTVGNWNIPEGKIITTCGRHVATSQYQDGQRLLRLVDVLTGDTLLERNYTKAAKSCQLPPRLMAWMEPSGKTEMLDLEAGALSVQPAARARARDGKHSPGRLRQPYYLRLKYPFGAAAQYGG